MKMGYVFEQMRHDFRHLGLNARWGSCELVYKNGFLYYVQIIRWFEQRQLGGDSGFRLDLWMVQLKWTSLLVYDYFRNNQ